MITEIISTSVYRRESFVISAGFTSYTFQSSAQKMHIESTPPNYFFAVVLYSYIFCLASLYSLCLGNDSDMLNDNAPEKVNGNNLSILF